MFLIGENPKTLMVLVRRPRTRVYSLACFGRKSHYRKDGTCKHTDAALERIKPGTKVRVEPFGKLAGKTGEAPK